MRLIPRRRPPLAAAALLTVLSCGPDQRPPTDPDDRPALAVSPAAALSFLQLSAGWSRTCGVTTDNRAYCWGDNAQGYLGDGTITDRAAPTPVAGNLRFRQISAGVSATCGVTTDFRAWCWGFGGRGDLGTGDTAEHHTPVAVAGGHQFRQVDVGFDHACAVTTPDNRVYCWGANTDGQLGIGNRSGPDLCNFGGACSLKPVAIASTIAFQQVATGSFHSCGVTKDERLFCWGLNQSGQVGDSSTVFRRSTPSRVGRGRRWRQVDGGRDFTCAVTTGNEALCWGNGRLGQLGNNHTFLSFWPRLVAGKHAFRRVTAGSGHACGETPSSGAWCWGNGRLGDGTNNSSLVPVAVTGGLFWGQLSAGLSHTCGKTQASVGYCWGSNVEGELGLGAADFAPHTSPTAIGPPK